MTQIPFTVDGVITDIDSQPVNKAVVEIINIRLEESATMLTNALGEYILDLSNFRGEYKHNDEIVIRSWIGDRMFRMQDIRQSIDINVRFLSQNLTLVGAQPVFSQETLNSNIILNNAYDPRFNAIRFIPVVVTSDGEILPVKGTKDSSGLYGLLDATS